MKGTLHRWKKVSIKTDSSVTELRSAYFVKSLEVSDRWGNTQIIWKLVLQVSDEHSKLRAPISHVVQPTFKK